MQMQPIVDGLEAEYGATVTFRQLNAQTDGQPIFEQLGLRGHPAFVIFDATGREVFRTLGIVEPARLVEALEGAARAAPE